MADKPTEDIAWGEGAAPTIDEPTAQRSNGYPAGFIPSGGNHNFQFRAIGRWLDWLARSAGTFLAPKAALDAIDANTPAAGGVESAIIRGRDGIKGGTTLERSNATRSIVGLVCDGEFLYALEQGVASTTAATVHIYDIGTAAPTDVSFTVGNSASAGAGSMVAIAANGTYIATAEQGSVSNQVRTFDMTGDPTGLIAFDHLATVVDMAMDDTFLYVVGADGGAGHEHVEVWNLSTQTKVADFDHGADVRSVFADGESYWIAGLAGTGTFNLRRMGKGTNTILDNIVLGGDVLVRNSIVAGENELYVATGTADLRRITKKNTGAPGTLVQLDTISFTTAAMAGLAIDDRYVYVSIDDGVYAIPVGEPLVDPYYGFQDDTLGTRTMLDVATDGLHCFIADDATAAGNIYQMNTGRVSTVWQKNRDAFRGVYQRKIQAG